MGQGLGAWARAMAVAALVATAAGFLAAGAGVDAASRPRPVGTSPGAAGPGGGRVVLGLPPGPAALAASGERPILPPPDRFDGPAPPPAPPPPVL
jgi:hypothetical protein